MQQQRASPDVRSGSRHSISHSTASPSAAAATSTVKAMPPSQMQASATGASTTAETTRIPRSPHRSAPSPALGAQTLGAQPGRAPKRRSRRAIRCQCRGEMLGAEVRPQHVQEHQLRIGGLPEQKVRQPLLAGGADDQVGIRHPGGGQKAGERVLVESAPDRACRPAPPRRWRVRRRRSRPGRRRTAPPSG